ncbi:hypothetical protein [Acidiphilium angustum]|uniref:hypothetical protein n=1 Tax=Acidiphilium angustum TaxID=523 RepID=UPI00049437BB|nr:hypothetical protein [Acidiphilium angustum]
MTDLTPAVRLYATLHNIKGRWVQDGQKLTPQLADILPRLAAEHERLVAERLAAVTAERDAAIADCQRWLKKYAELQGATTVAYVERNVARKERDAVIAERDRLMAAVQEISRQKKATELETEYDVELADFEGGYDRCIDRARAAINPEAKS